MTDNDFKQNINGRDYSFNQDNFEVSVDGVTIKLDQVYHNEDNCFMGIYVCSCSPERNPERVFDDEKFPEACNHIKNMQKEEYLLGVVRQVYKESNSRSDVLYLWNELLEGKELGGLLKIVADFSVPQEKK